MLKASAERLDKASMALQRLLAQATLEPSAGLTLTQLRALAAAAETGACSLNTLAAALDITTSTASRLVDRLVAAGVLDRRTSDINRREVTLRVTTSGRRLLDQQQSARHEIFAELLRGLSRTDARALLRGLEAVQRYVDGS
jgi:DNA-binding MarR family transcriptional regulator